MLFETVAVPSRKGLDHPTPISQDRIVVLDSATTSKPSQSNKLDIEKQLGCK